MADTVGGVWTMGTPIIPIRPRDLPRVRDSITEFGASGVIDKLYELKRLQNWRDGDHEEFRILAESMKHAAALQDADLYYVSPEMCDLVATASKSLPEFTLAQDDAPCRKGFAWLARPLIERTLAEKELKQPAVVAGIGWESVDDTLQLAIHTWRDAINIIPAADMLQLKFPPVFPLGCWRVPIGEDGRPVPIGDTTSTNVDAVYTLSFLKSLWLLLRQPLARQEIATPSRTERRQAIRAGYREPPPVRVIQLRRPSSGPPAEAGGMVEWHHQWIVRGHWRNQAYGSGRALRRPVWIAPFVKGPEGAPLLGGEKVYVVDH